MNNLLTRKHGLVEEIKNNSWFVNHNIEDGYEVVLVEMRGGVEVFDAILKPGQTLQVGERLFGKYKAYAVDMRLRTIVFNSPFLSKDRGKRIIVELSVGYQVVDSKALVLEHLDPLADFQDQIILAIKGGLKKFPVEQIDEKVITEIVYALAFPKLGLKIVYLKVLQSYLDFDNEQGEKFEYKNLNMLMQEHRELTPSVLEAFSQREQKVLDLQINTFKEAIIKYINSQKGKNKDVDPNQIAKILENSLANYRSNQGESKRLRVFLCHSSSDKPKVLRLYNRLLNQIWIDPWLDQKKIKPGQNWDLEIESAVKNSDVVIVCLSQNSVTKEGYIQKEIRLALDKADEKLEDTIFIIPLRLENCNVPSRLAKWQWLDIFSRDWYKLLLEALEIRANKLDVKVR